MRTLALMLGEVQPGDRAPAPEPLALVQDFVNTAIRGWDEDLLRDAARFDAWLGARGFAPLKGDEERAWLAEIREALHAGLSAGEDERGATETLDEAARRAAETLDEAARRAGLLPRFLPARLEPAGDGIERTVGTILAAAWTAQADGTWRRLKTCPGDHCGWAFYDRSVNASATWCSMRVCGQRSKAKAYYRRRAVSSPSRIDRRR